MPVRSQRHDAADDEERDRYIQTAEVTHGRKAIDIVQRQRDDDRHEYHGQDCSRRPGEPVAHPIPRQ